MTFFTHGGSARESRRQSGGCARCFSQRGGRVAQGESEKRGTDCPCHKESC